MQYIVASGFYVIKIPIFVLYTSNPHYDMCIKHMYVCMLIP